MVRLADAHHPRVGIMLGKFLEQLAPDESSPQQLLTTRERTSCVAIWMRISGPTQDRNVMI